MHEQSHPDYRTQNLVIAFFTHKSRADCIGEWNKWKKPCAINQAMLKGLFTGRTRFL